MTKGLRKAVDQNCKDCIYDSQQEGTWQQQVEKCTITSCAIYPFRLVSYSSKLKAKKERVDNMTPEQLIEYKLRYSSGFNKKHTDLGKESLIS